MRKVKLRCAGLAVLAAGILCLAVTLKTAFSKELPQGLTGLFCWDKAVIRDYRALFEEMNLQRISNIYQYFPEDAGLELKEEFLAEAAEHHIGVYYLTGSPEWGLDETGQEMRKMVSDAAEINRAVGGEQQFRGIVMDTEPYLTKAWKKDREEVMEDYVDGMIEAYRLAQENGLEFIACIPYHYDNKDLTRELERLIAEGCDKVAVMNYNRREECLQIETEVALARKYGKKIINIYELQAPGSHDITENNTYYQEGMEGVAESMERMRGYFEYEGLEFALHDFNALKDMTGYE